MRISYDEKADAITFSLGEGRISKDVELAPNVFAGYERGGRLIEVQFLNVSKSERAWITLAAAAAQLDKSTRTLLRWIESGKLKAKKVGGEYQIDVKELSRIAEAG